MSLNSVNLGSGFAFYNVRHAQDAASFSALNQAVTGEGEMCERLLEHHPDTTYAHYFFVYDKRRRCMASTSCLIPWQIAYEGVLLNTAMLEMVATHPDYRHRGLVRVQVEHFHQKAINAGADLCIIQGIPFFYRQFGYAYVLDHMPFDVLPSERIPQSRSRKTPTYTLRPAAVEDAAVLHELYTAEMHQHTLYVHRNEAYWRYLLQYARYPVEVLVNTATGHIHGYGCVEFSKTNHVRVRESAFGNEHQGLALLRLLKSTGNIDIFGSDQTELVKVARRHGSVRGQAGQWLVYIPSFLRILSTLAPVFEQRLANAGQTLHSCELTLNLYHEAFKLVFTQGRLRLLEPLGFVDTSMGAEGGDLWIPPDAFVRLLFGYRNLESLMDAWPDIVVKASSRHLWDILFPAMDSLLLMPY